MACIKCGGPTKDGESLCEKCFAEANRSVFQPTPDLNSENTVFPLNILESDEIGKSKPKKKKFNKIVIAFVSLFVVLIGVASIGELCFNRDFMELIQGKTKYAQNIEQATAKSSASQIVSYLDEGVKAFKSYDKKKTLNVTSQFNIKLEDEFLKNLNLPAEESVSIQQTVKYLNSLKVDTKTMVGEKGMQTSFVVADPSALKLTVDSLTYNDGKMYVHIPELLNKYLSLGDQTASQFSLYNLSQIKYDPAKLQTSLEKLAAIYVNSLTAAEMKAENNQSLTVDGVTVEGQKLTASLDAAKTSAMVKAIAQAAKSDDYLYTFASDNYGLLSAVAGFPSQTSSEKLTKESYGKLIDEFLSRLNLGKDGVTFSAISYLSQNGSLLAHSYESKDKTGEGKLNYLITDKKYAVEFIVNQNQGFTLTNTKTGEGTGKLQFKIRNAEEPKNIGLNIDYSGCKTVKFLGSDTTVGKYLISLYDPDHAVAKYVGQLGLPAGFDKLDQSSLSIEMAPDGDKISSSMQLSMPGILSLSVTGKMSGTSGSPTIQSPPQQSQIIDLSKDESGEAMNELPMNGITFLSKALENDPELAAVLNGFGVTKEQLEMLVAYGQG